MTEDNVEQIVDTSIRYILGYFAYYDNPLDLLEDRDAVATVKDSVVEDLCEKFDI